jgi:hypothetical protein
MIAELKRLQIGPLVAEILAVQYLFMTSFTSAKQNRMGL